MRDDTVHQLLRLLLKHGGMTVRDLALHLHLSLTATRQHVERLQAAGLVVAGSVHHHVGRPSTVYVLTPKAYEEFPQAYQPLLARILEVLAEERGGDGLRKFLSEVAARCAQEAKPRLQGAHIDERVGRLLEFLTGLGFWVESERGERGVEIKEYHSPVFQAAQRFPQLYDMVHSLIEAALDMPLVRLKSKREGDPYTVYLIPACSPDNSSDTSKEAA